jgi:hypothetical protein
VSDYDTAATQPSVRKSLEHFLPNTRTKLLSPEAMLKRLPNRMKMLAVGARVRLAVAFPADHCLARNRPIRLASLADEVFVMFARQVGPVYFDNVTATCREQGFSPRILHEVRSVASQVASSTAMVRSPANYDRMDQQAGSEGPLSSQLMGGPLLAGQRLRKSDPKRTCLAFEEAPAPFESGEIPIGLEPESTSNSSTTPPPLPTGNGGSGFMQGPIRALGSTA